MFDRASPDSHEARIGVDAGLHAIKRTLIDQAVDRALGAGRASRLQGAARAGRRSIADRSIAGVNAGGAERLTGGTMDRVAPFVIDELSWSEMVGVHRPAFDRCCHLNVLPLAAGDFLGVRIAAVRQHLEPIGLQHLFDCDRHWVEEMAVVGVIVDVMVDDETALDVDGALKIVRRQLGRVRVTYWLGLGLAEDKHLLIPLLKLVLPPSEALLSTFQRLDGCLEALPMERLIVEALRDSLVDDVQPVEIVGDLFFGMRDVAGEPLSSGDILRAGDRTHLRTVKRDRATADQAMIAAELDEGGAGGHDGLRTVVPESRDGSVVGRKTAQEPKGLQVAQACALKMARRANLIEIAPDVQAEHITRMIAGPASCRSHCPREAKLAKIQAFNEGVDHADERIVFNIVVDAGREETLLASVLAIYERYAVSPRSGCGPVLFPGGCPHLARRIGVHNRDAEPDNQVGPRRRP